MGSIEGHRALVTGAGSGIGRAIARALAERGARVAVEDPDKSRAEQTFGGLPGEPMLLEGDVADSLAVVGWLERILDEWGGLEILVTHGGHVEVPEEVVRRAKIVAHERLSGQGHRTPLDATVLLDDGLWRSTVESHLGGTFFCVREALRLMTPARYGRIVTMASIGGLSGLMGAPHHNAASGGVIAFTKSVAREVIPFGITVNCIAPGWTDTPLLAGMDEFMRRSTLAQIPVCRYGTPEEVVPSALLFVDPDNGYMTGQVVSPHGGAVY